MNGQVNPLFLLFEESNANRNFLFFDAGFLEGGNEVFDGAGISKRELLLDLLVDAALCQIVHSRSVGARAKLCCELFLSLCQAEEKKFAFLVFFGVHGNSSLAGKKADRFREREILVSSQESDCVPACSAAETAKDLLLRTDAERWRLVIVKGTETLEVLADLFKRYKRSDEFDDVGGVKNAVDGLLRDAGHIIAWFNPRFSDLFR